MSVQVQVNFSDEMLRQVDYYAEIMGVSRSALCSVLIGEGIFNFNSKQMHEAADSLPGGDEPHLFAIEKRLYQLFDGWRAQFENMPDYKPDIKVNDGKVYIDDLYLCAVEEDITGAKVDINGIEIYIDKEDKDKKMFLEIAWLEEYPPVVFEIYEVEE